MPEAVVVITHDDDWADLLAQVCDILSDILNIYFKSARTKAQNLGLKLFLICLNVLPRSSTS
jgi:hypothetical protein